VKLIIVESLGFSNATDAYSKGSFCGEITLPVITASCCAFVNCRKKKKEAKRRVGMGNKQLGIRYRKL
jgi:hypothetical protein